MKSSLNKIMFTVAIAISLFGFTSAFADVIHMRNGQEVQNAKVTKIGSDEVEYKVGSRDVVYTAKKADIAIIFYDDGSKETFANESAPSQNQVQNNSQVMQNQIIIGGTTVVESEPLNPRWKTFWLNMLLPGVGSINYMDDWTGAYISWGILGGGVLASVIYAESSCSEHAGHREGAQTYENCVIVGSVSAWAAAAIIWNAYRSYTFDYEKKSASKYGDINMAILPSRHGNGMAYGLMYNLGF